MMNQNAPLSYIAGFGSGYHGGVKSCDDLSQGVSRVILSSSRSRV